LAIGSSWLLAASIAIGNTLAPLLSVALLKRAGFQAALNRKQDISLLITSACLGMTVSASGGVMSLHLAGLMPLSAIGAGWLTWWLGDMVGVLLAVPAILSFSRDSIGHLRQPKWEVLLWIIGAVPAIWLSFFLESGLSGRGLPLAFLTLPMLAWAGLRCGIMCSSLAVLVFSIAGALGTALGYGTFHTPDTHLSHFLLWSYITVAVSMGLLITALQAERVQVERSLRESKARLEAAASAGIVGVWDWDIPNNRLVWDSMMYKLYGIREDNFGGAYEAWSSALHPEDKTHVEAEVQAALRGEREYEPEFRVVWPNGSIRHLKARSQLSFDAGGRPLRMIGVNYDISEQKTRQLMLDRLVAERTQELAAAKAAAETANVAKSVFLANMSHEIRTPLTTITGTPHLIRRAGVTPEQAEQLDKIDLAGEHLLAIINTILDLSKIEAGKFSLEETEIHVGGIVMNVANLLSEWAQSKGLHLVIEAETLPLHLLGDPTRLQQGLLNYATNAIKFTEQGTVTLRVQAEAEDEDTVQVRFEVQDTGIGIAPEVLTKLFNAFEQADSTTTRKYGGTGLGLVITKKIAQLMDGNAGATSSIGKGSTFWFTARLKKSQAMTAASPTKVAEDAEAILKRDLQSRRILLVEDDMLNQPLFKRFLEDAGMVVDVADHGAEAVNLVNQNDYALIIMDMHMPVMDGLEATRRIRQLARGATVPILALTANAFAEDRARCIEAGMNDFFSKPVLPKTMFATILKWLQQRSPIDA
jgi:PAS domain S-box-containing protein